MTSRPAAPPAHRPLLILLLGVALVVVNTWPLAVRLDQIGRAESHDGRYGLWQATWVARALVTDPLHVYDANIFYPHRSTLAFSEPSLLAGAIGLPAYLVTRSPYATENLATLGYFLLSFLCAFWLGRYLTGDTTAAIALGIAFAFSPYMFARTAQLPMMGIFGLPLTLAAMHALVEAPSGRRALGVAGALWLQALACGYYTVFAILIVAAGLIFFGLQNGRWKSGAFWRWGIVAALLSIALLLPLVWPHVRLGQSQGFSRPVAEAYQFAADWRAWLASSAWAHRWMLPLLGTWNEVLFPGFLPLALGGAGAWIGLRGRLAARARTVTTRSLVLFYVLLAIVAAWLAFGPAGGLYAVLYETVPVFSFIRAAGRFGILVTLAVAVLMAFALAHMRQAGGRLNTLATVLIFALAAELFSAPRPMTPALPVSSVYRVLAEQPPGPAIEFPFFPRQLERNSEYVLMSTAHWQRIVNGYGAFWPADIQQLANDTRDFPSRETFDRVRAWGVRYIVVHPTSYERYGFAAAADVIARLDALAPALTLVASDQHVRLYRVSD
ncbi:MAG TPA: hypothetical protein VH740_15470 [Vicinamibacterales bacterium]|jgi:hypothetical protein